MANHPPPVDDLAFHIRLNPTIAFRFLVGVTALLLAISLTLTAHVYVVKIPWLPYTDLGFFLFDPEETHNVHGWFEASVLLLGGLLLAGIGSGYLRGGRRWFGLGWCWLAAPFLILSLDAAAAHMSVEHAISLRSGPGLVNLLALVFVLGLLLFAKALPVETRRAFVIAALVIGCGEVVLDLVSERLYSGEVRPFSSRVVSNVEEAVELIGEVMVIRIALTYIAVHCHSIEVGTRERE